MTDIRSGLTDEQIAFAITEGSKLGDAIMRYLAASNAANEVARSRFPADAHREAEELGNAALLLYRLCISVPIDADLELL